jgi:hypothetical protein
MGRVFIPTFLVLAAATVALLSEIVAHDGFGIATDAIRTDALRAAACAVIVLTFGIVVKRDGPPQGAHGPNNKKPRHFQMQKRRSPSPRARESKPGPLRQRIS